MSVRGGLPAPIAVDYGAETSRAENEHTANAPAEYGDRGFGARVQGGISGRNPQAMVIDYDGAGGSGAVVPGPPSGYTTVVPHGRGWVDGAPPDDRVIGTVWPEDRAGNNDAPSNKVIRFFRRYPFVLSHFQPNDYDPDLVGRERLPLPRLARFAMRFTMRHEYGQDAQRFSGLHTRVIIRARDRASRMVAPRSQRLTARDVPSTYGSSTQVLR